jgi:hypothetical protein
MVDSRSLVLTIEAAKATARQLSYNSMREAPAKHYIEELAMHLEQRLSHPYIAAWQHFTRRWRKYV